MSAPDITLLRPLWLLALPALAVFGWALWRRQGALGDWGKAADGALLAVLSRLGRVDSGGQERLRPLMLAAAVLALMALAGPAVERRDTLSYRNLDGVLFVVDVSDGLAGSAAWPEVLTMGRFGIGKLGTRPGGIIVYAGDAYVATDMTLDHRQLGQTFLLIGPDTVPDPGVRPERALALAAKLLAEAEVIAGDVILFTDGTGLGPASLSAADAIAATGARLSVVATAAGPPPEIERHAALGGGRVFAPGMIEEMKRFLAEDARARLERQNYPLLFWHDMGRYLLMFALAPLALMFRREGG